MLSGGVGGLWFSSDGSARWSEVSFEGLDRAPQIFDIAVDPRAGWDKILLGTDDGIWRLAADRMQASRVGWNGRHVTSAQIHAASGTVVAVLDKTELLRFSEKDVAGAVTHDLSKVSAADAPTTVTLAKAGFDLHATAGLSSIEFSTLVNDFSGIALPALCVTGLLYWYLPRRKARQHMAGGKISVAPWLRWLFRVHVFVAGILVTVPLIYLSITGIAMGHKFGFNGWARSISLDSDWLPGNYRLKTLKGELMRVYAPTENVDFLVAHTRLGGLTSTDGGTTWRYDADYPLKLSNYWAASRYRAVGDYEFVSDEGNRHFARQAGKGEWINLNTKDFGLTLDASRVGNSFVLYTWYGVFKGDPKSGFTRVNYQPAPLQGLDLAYLVRVVHGLLIYNKVLVWFNDASAVAAALLAITGIANWLLRNKKWI